MNKYIFITTGTRDLAFNQNIPPELLNQFQYRNLNNYCYPLSPRKDGQKIYTNLSQVYDYLQLPIIEPFFQQTILTSNFDPQSTHIILIGTDQPLLPQKERYYENDTLFYNLIIQQILHQKYNIPLSNISVHNISHPQLNLYDEMYDYFQTTHLSDLLPPYEIYLLPQGGIDAINLTLMLYLNENFSNIHQFYVDENAHIKELQFPIKFKLKLIEQLIDNYEYTSLLNFSFIPNQSREIINFISSSLNNENIKKNKFVIKELNIQSDLEWLALKFHILLEKKEYNILVIYLISFLENQIDQILKKFNIVRPSNNTDLITKLKNLPTTQNEKLITLIKELKSSTKSMTLKNYLSLSIQLLNSYHSTHFPDIQNKNQYITLIDNIYTKFYTLRNRIVHDFTKRQFSEKLITQIQNTLNELNTYLNINPKQKLSQINSLIKNSILNNQ